MTSPLIILLIIGGVTSLILLLVGLYFESRNKDKVPNKPAHAQPSEKKSSTFSGPFMLVSYFVFAIAIILVYNDVTRVEPSQAAVTPMVSSNPASHPTLNPTALPTAFIPPKAAAYTGSGCTLRGPYPDPACTPGAALNVTSSQICAAGYLASVPAVIDTVINRVYVAYGIMSHSAGQYEIDHFLPLELGGSNDITNLWPELASPTPGFHEKDRVEIFLRQQVCSGLMTLAQAQSEVATNWVTVYNSLIGGLLPDKTSAP